MIILIAVFFLLYEGIWSIQRTVTSSIQSQHLFEKQQNRGNMYEKQKYYILLVYTLKDSLIKIYTPIFFPEFFL